MTSTPAEPSVEALRTTRLATVLLAATAALLATDLLLKLLAPPRGGWQEVRNLFSVSNESNVPTFWNAALLMLISAACAFVAALVRGSRLGWTLAALMSFALGADEIVRGHERLRTLGSVISSTLPFDLPSYSWLLPGAVLALAGAAPVWVWTGHLPKPVRTGLRCALLVYGIGAVGFEALSGWIELEYGVGGAYAIAALAEECLEMTACVIAVVAVLRMVSIGEMGSHRVALVPHERGAARL